MKTIERTFIDELNAYLASQECHHRADVVGTREGDKLYFEIHWGDWKHNHLRVYYLVEQFCQDRGYNVERDVIVTEEDGSDAYSAEHYYKVVKKGE